MPAEQPHKLDTCVPTPSIDADSQSHVAHCRTFGYLFKFLHKPVDVLTRGCDNNALMMNKNSTIRIKSLSPGVTAASGFVAAGVECGVREAGRRDLGLLFSELPCETAAVFTRNAVWGAPLVVTREAVETGGVQAIVANSGNANAATGERASKTPVRCRRSALLRSGSKLERSR